MVAARAVVAGYCTRRGDNQKHHLVDPGAPPEGVGPGSGARAEPELPSDGSAALGS
jgi:hypothetical protein